jgi:broad specificity phosphatase PhoE
MSTLFILRHGQASFGHDDYDQLSPTGYRQARTVGRHLRDIGITFDAIYTGQMARQRQTFESVADVFDQFGTPLPEPVVTADLNEYDSTGVWNHFFPALIRENPELELEESRLLKDPKAFQSVFAWIVHRWVEGAHEGPGIESWPAFRTRIDQGLQNIMRQEGSGKNVLVCSSAGPIAVAVQLATGMSDRQCLGISWQVMNASLTRFRYNAEKMTLVGFNDVAALEIQGDPALLTYR